MRDGERNYLFGILVDGFSNFVLKLRKANETSDENRFGAAESRPVASMTTQLSKGKRMSDPNRVFNVLFLCTHNSARSIMGEAILNNLAVSRGRFKGFSAGSHPSGKPNPIALDCIRSAGLPTESLRSKDWNEFSSPDAPKLDFVFTVCDNAAKEVCPIWPGQPMTAHWGLPDPAAVEGSDDDKRRAFSSTFRSLSSRINIFVSLPMDKLDKLSLQKKLEEIGKSN